MFRGKSIDDYYREVQTKVQQEIVGQSDSNIIGLDLAEYTEYLYEKYRLCPVEQDKSRENLVEQVRELRDYTDHFGDRRRGEVMVARIEYPIVPTQTNEQVLSLFPNNQNSQLPRFDVKKGHLVLKVDVSLLISRVGDTPTGGSEIASALSNLEWWINSRNRDISRLNPEFRTFIEQAIQSRKEYVARTRADFASMIERVNIPLKLRRSAESQPTPINIRPELRPVLKPPTPKRQQEYTLKREEVLAIVELIRRYGRSLETTPHAVAGQDEEDIRALFLAQLNGLVDGAATGETFSKLGKSDIHLNLPKGEILIAECKIWRGQKELAEAIDQLFGYLTWRESYGIIIVFVRNKDFTNVLAEAEQTIQSHSTFRQRFLRHAENHFESHHTFPDDPKRTVEIHHLLFHFPQ